MGNKNFSVSQLNNFFSHFIKFRSCSNHFISDSGHSCNKRRDMAFGIYQRLKFIHLHNAFVRSYFGSSVPDSPLRAPPPPPPDVPFQFAEGDSPLSGKDAKP